MTRDGAPSIDASLSPMRSEPMQTKPRRVSTLASSGCAFPIEGRAAMMIRSCGWNPDVNSNAGVLGVWSLAAGRGNLYVGGDFTGIHGVTQERFAILPRR